MEREVDRTGHNECVYGSDRFIDLLFAGNEQNQSKKDKRSGQQEAKLLQTDDVENENDKGDRNFHPALFAHKRHIGFRFFRCDKLNDRTNNHTGRAEEGPHFRSRILTGDSKDGFDL